LKKALKFIIPFAVIGLLFSTQFANGTFGVVVGATYTYDVIKSNMSVAIGANSGSYSGYEIDDQVFAEGTQVEVEVTAVNPLDVAYDVKAGSYFESDASNNLDLGFTTLLSILTPIVALALVEQDWNQTEVEEVGSPLLIPFVENETTTWQTYIDMANDLQTSAPVPTTAFGQVGLNATYSDTVSTFVFELYFGGTMAFNDTLITDYVEVNAALVHHFQFAFDKPTGVMLGMRMEGSVIGTSNGTAVSFQYNMHTEKVGYNLPKYEFGGGGFIPGFEWFIVLPAIGFIGTIVAIVRRRK
jgi:hypothetical protein